MAWETDLVTMVRVLINDLAETEQFDDERIQQSLVVGGMLTARDVALSTTYTFDIGTPDITPDPTENGDDTASALFVLRAACILDMNRFQTAVKGGIRVRDGDSEVDTTAGLSGYDSIIQAGACSSYQALVKKATSNMGASFGGCVTGPFTHPDLCIGNYSGGYFANRRFFDDFCGRCWS